MQLEQVKYKNQRYYHDIRLQEFRPVNKPYKSIPFGSKLGSKIIANGFYIEPDGTTIRITEFEEQKIAKFLAG